MIVIFFRDNTRLFNQLTIVLMYISRLSLILEMSLMSIEL